MLRSYNWAQHHVFILIMKYIVLILGLLWTAKAVCARSRIQIRNANEIVATIGNVKGTLQIRADKSSFVDKNTTLFTGNVTITAKNQNNATLHLRTDEAIVESEKIELQVYDYKYEGQSGWIDHLYDVAGEPHAPLSAFLKALNTHPTLSNFRMKYRLALAGDGSASTILYNRQQHTLKYFEQGSLFDGQQSYTNYYLYKGVTDAVLKKLAAKYLRSGKGYSDGYFGFLTEFGCQRIKQ